MAFDEHQRAYLRWGTIIVILSAIPPLLYSHWAVSANIESQTFLYLSLIGLFVATLIAIAWRDAGIEPIAVSWSIVPFWAFIIVGIIGSPLLGVDWPSPAGYPLGWQVLVMPLVVLAAIGVHHVVPDLGESTPKQLRPVAERRRAIIGLGVIATAGITGTSALRTPSTRIEAADPGFDRSTSDGRPQNELHEHSFNGFMYTIGATLDLDRGTQRIVVETPSGDTFSQALPRDVNVEEPATIFVQAMSYDRDTYETGTYSVGVESAWGLQIDEVQVQADTPASLEITDVDLLEDDDPVVIEVTLRYEGSFPTDFFGDNPIVEVDDPDYEATAEADFWRFVTSGDELTVEITFTDTDSNSVTPDPGSYDLTIVSQPPNLGSFEAAMSVEIPAGTD